MPNELNITAALQHLFEQWSGEPCTNVLKLGAHGSKRQYYRMRGNTNRCIAAYGDDARENKAFVYYSQYFNRQCLPVPEVYAVSEDGLCYLQQDLGDTTLFDYIYDKKRNGGGFDADTVQLYRRVVADLARFQTVGRDIDYSYAYPRSDFDRQSIQWDLNYFKYYFLKLADIQFDEELLERDYKTFEDLLLSADTSFFMYRDFQPRNIMLTADGQLYYIDYQGGRRGAAQYDVASLLYSARSEMPEAIRQELLAHYMECRGFDDGGRRSFMEHFYHYALVRIMQAMGAYGYRGYIERKEHFIKSLPLAVSNLHTLCEAHPIGGAMPHLAQVLDEVCRKKPTFDPPPAQYSGRLNVKIYSFSYRKGLPVDDSGNGGGHVFDCRALPNPGRYEQFRAYTGKDRPVIEFLEREAEVARFLRNTEDVVAQSVVKYIERHFTSLMVSFGCTGGQHRSVYCAERMAEFVRQRFDCDVTLIHREQEQL
ncbi:MAG: phosphotransferase [Bacteroidales bacterium]|nr:phosphotransferase [Bacteroidales bacterium]